MPTPRCAAIHDLSGVGRCSLTVALPVLSAMGVQCCPLPTALLSTQTGGFENFTFLDLSHEMASISAHWATLGLSFQAIYSGFLGSAQQIDLVSQFFRAFRREGTLVVVDPVMGDHGEIYQTYTAELCTGMAQLAAQADVITPNLTEAALLLGLPADALEHRDEAAYGEVVQALSLSGRRSVVLTGVSLSPVQVGAMCFDASDRSCHTVQSTRVPREFPGTGDLFASVLTGALLQKAPLPAAAAQAADFVRLCMERTVAQDLPPREGVDFEPLLGHLVPDPPKSDSISSK